MILTAAICIAIILPTTSGACHHHKCDSSLCPVTKAAAKKSIKCYCPVCTECNCLCPRVPTPTDEEKCRWCPKNPPQCKCPECIPKRACRCSLCLTEEN